MRGNLMVASLATLITNPLTFPPIYYAAFRVGSWVLHLGAQAEVGGLPPAGVHGVSSATALGLGIFAVVSAVAGFITVQIA